MKRIPLLATILAIILVSLTVPVFFTIGGLSLMTFDSGVDSVAPWLIAGGVVGACLLIPTASLIGAILLIRRNQTWLGLVLSLLPTVVLAVFWLWLSQQSFT